MKYIIISTIIFWNLILLDHISSFETVIYACIAAFITIMIVGYKERKRNEHDQNH